MKSLKTEKDIKNNFTAIFTLIVIFIIMFIGIYIGSRNVNTDKLLNPIQEGNSPKLITMENVSSPIEAKPNRKITDTFGTYDFKTLSIEEKSAKMMFYKKIGMSTPIPNQSLLNQDKMSLYLDNLKKDLINKFGYSKIINERMIFSYNGLELVCKPIFLGDYASGYKACINSDNEDAPKFLKEINEYLINYKMIK